MSFFAEAIKKLDQEKLKDIREFVDDQMVEIRSKPPMTANDWVRASGIHTFCPRYEAIRSIKNIDDSETIPGRLSKTFSFGRMFERFMRDEVLARLGIVIGKWRCRSCDAVTQVGEPNRAARHRYPKQCPVCGKSSFVYEEEELEEAGAMIRGHCDGFIYWGNDYALLEMKTSNDKYFTQIKKSGKPLDAHFSQAQVYMRLAGYKKTLFWYFNKNTSEDLTIWVDYDPAYARLFFDRGYELKEFFNKGTLPKRVCPIKESDRAKTCSVCNICFDELQG